jgi:aquaporin related protein
MSRLQVTLGLCLVGALPYLRGVLVIISQLLGAITAAAITSALFPGPLTVNTTLGGGTSTVQGLFIEMFLTAELIFTIFMLAAEKHKATFIAPIGIGLALFISELTGVYFTGGSLNPARSFGPAVVSHQFPHEHWIYWVGPILGALIASAFYKFIKMLEYESANPGQDSGYTNGEHFNPNNANANADPTFTATDYAEKGQANNGTGAGHRKWSVSPAPAPVDEQYHGLEAHEGNEELGGMTSSVLPRTYNSRESNASTLAPDLSPTGNFNSGMKKQNQKTGGIGPNANTAGPGAGR